MEFTPGKVIATVVTLLALAGSWIGFSTYFASANSVTASHTLMVEQRGRALDQLETKVAGALDKHSRSLLKTHAHQLQTDIRHYQHQIEYYKMVLKKKPEDIDAKTGLELAQRFLLQTTEALAKLREDTS